MPHPSVTVPAIEDEKLWAIFACGEELGLRMEASETGIVWEAMPAIRHQELALAAFWAIQLDGECFRALDPSVRFASGTVKRPDVAIFCKRPAEEEGFVHAVPEAVIEITSLESEGKDLVTGPPTYLANGVKDVVVFHRSKGAVVHWTASGSRTSPSPAKIKLSCGCVVTV